MQCSFTTVKQKILSEIIPFEYSWRKRSVYNDTFLFNLHNREAAKESSSTNNQAINTLLPLKFFSLKIAENGFLLLFFSSQFFG